MSISETSNEVGSPAVVGTNTTTGDGIWGECSAGRGVVGVSNSGTGIWGHTVKGRAIVGVNNEDGTGVWGETITGRAIVGVNKDGAGVWGETNTGTGVVGISNGIGVHGKGGQLAGLFEGDVEVTGDLRLRNADCAEDFDIACLEQVEPGTVMVIDSEGALRPSDRAYDKRVAGVISGAGNYKPGIVLDKQKSSQNRMPIALMGKVYCKVDAIYGAIEVGDLLTTSPTPGNAMKVSDPLKALGAMIGKALQPLQEGQDLIPILIALQ